MGRRRPMSSYHLTALRCNFATILHIFQVVECLCGRTIHQTVSWRSEDQIWYVTKYFSNNLLFFLYILSMFQKQILRQQHSLLLISLFLILFFCFFLFKTNSFNIESIRRFFCISIHFFWNYMIKVLH